MPRDRPSAGGQDSTVEGQFPSDLGGAGGARVEPRKISEPFGQQVTPSINPANRSTPQTYSGESILSNLARSFDPILKIDDSPIGGTLSGIYRFSSAYSQYLLNKTDKLISISNIVTPNNYASKSSPVSFAGQNFIGIDFIFTATPTGTGTISSGALSLGVAFSGLTPTNFPTYTPDNMTFANYNSIPSGDRLYRIKHINPIPAYPLRFIGTRKNVYSLGAIPNSNTTFSVTPFIAASGAGTSVSFNLVAYAQGLSGFNTTAIVSTLQSTL